ncbi:hypothetical protein SERLA73DRAFT_184638 [Serpula lacrymans var. lacrymans S7.3]|uniref:VLRF1 domain-containing protein n=2 Tax=Serpula lacrymans var. lacrymans TaxID=341189 RepID=F8Q4T5_SERL3|nr:uncharacterized protein SERLADRAFT_472524 [Serpula lacrymans var. lacrymans S7.9]EGN96562.1 hypothetical protein SERLA73DRAFT_184638 [Serpula lacrymans var. lacrymans S7.3]EGO22137.1 hypothetical protein SERLADRAFT_472524 [Serpula lacrymans var. lacrymans S7.9]
MERFHVFSLPPALLQTLTPRNLISQTPPRSESPVRPSAPQATSNSRACNICTGAAFVDVNEQRSHFRSDWHRYNVKIRLSGGSPVSESEFTQLVDGLEDSISGSASSDDESSSGDSDAVEALVSKNKKTTRSTSPSYNLRRTQQTALAWFHSPPATQIGIYKTMFPTNIPAAAYLTQVKDMQTRLEGGRKWAMFMVAGGHFAGAVVQVSRPAEEDVLEQSKSKRKPPKPKPETEVLRHKTFHRYTTRRKQGGSQSVNDNSKGNAKSAGAQLRRYGEQALRDDIRNLLEEWADEINDCELIWIRASGSNRRIFLDYERCIIQKGDERLRTFPFPTRRPTQSELSRCLLELTQVKVSHLTEDALRAQDEAYLASLPKPKVQPTVEPTPEPDKPKVARLTKEEEVFREKWQRLLEMVSKGRLEPLKTFWDRESSHFQSVNVTIPSWTGDRRATLLQVAAQSGQEELTRWLLEDMHADPTIAVPVGGQDDEEAAQASDASDTPSPLLAGSRRTAYDLARSKGTRNVFRRCAATHPDWWDWLGAARVPSALSQKMEEEREEKKAQRRKGLKEKIREREAKAKEREAAKPEVKVEQIAPPKVQRKPQDPNGPQKLGGSSGGSDGVMGLTPEMRARVERERRARAAEARLKALGGR